MNRDKMTVNIDHRVLADTDADATRDGLNRSAYVERVLRDEHYRRLLADVPAPSTALPARDEQNLRELLAWQRNPGQPA